MSTRWGLCCSVHNQSSLIRLPTAVHNTSHPNPGTKWRVGMGLRNEKIKFLQASIYRCFTKEPGKKGNDPKTRNGKQQILASIWQNPSTNKFWAAGHKYRQTIPFHMFLTCKRKCNVLPKLLELKF